MNKTLSLIESMFGMASRILSASYSLLSKQSLPIISGSIELKGIKASVKVIRDRWGIPHIYAENLADLMFAQGFVHAQDRLWQMEFNRRITSGRLSEILGEVSLPLDQWMRTIGMHRVVEQEIFLLNEETRSTLQSYAEGINAHIDQKNFPVEFKLLGFSPEYWTISDTLRWSKMMSWTLSVNWEAEIVRHQLLKRLGPEKASELDVQNYQGSPAITAPIIIGDEAIKRTNQARKFFGPSSTNGVGSNNWVISGKRTITGKPLLANDMHLGLSIPSVWYENELKAEDLHLSGVTFPGIPGIIAGHNQYVAWGFTNGFPDVQDLYMEHLNRTKDGHVQYEYKGEWLDAQVIQEVIHVKGQKPVIEEVVITHHGPIINKLSPDFSGEQPLALQWISLQPSNMFNTILQMNKATDCDSFLDALRLWNSPSQNTVFADTKGNIAYKLTGKIPIRQNGNGLLPVPGWTGEYEWIGFIPFEELPQLINPSEGFIVTANNRVVAKDYPYHLSFDYCKGDRAQRITELIQSKEMLSVEDMKAFQFDQNSITARKFINLFKKLNSPEQDLQAVINRMRVWHGDLLASSPEATIYELFVERLIQRLLSKPLGDLAIYYAGKGITPVLAESSIMAERSREWLEMLLESEESSWYNLGNNEKREDVLLIVLRETVDDLKQNMGPEIDDWNWGKLHKLIFSHPLGSIKILNKIFNRGPYPLGGDADTVWATGSSRHDHTQTSIVGPPFRFIADLSDLDHCLGLLTPGQSGQPSSPHYDDNIRAWFNGDYHPMYFNEDAVKRESGSTLLLMPLH